MSYFFFVSLCPCWDARFDSWSSPRLTPASFQVWCFCDFVRELLGPLLCRDCFCRHPGRRAVGRPGVASAEPGRGGGAAPRLEPSPVATSVRWQARLNFTSAESSGVVIFFIDGSDYICPFDAVWVYFALRFGAWGRLCASCIWVSVSRPWCVFIHSWSVGKSENDTADDSAPLRSGAPSVGDR